MKNLVVFASGSGTNFQSLIDAVRDSRINAKISGLICNKSDVGAIERAWKANIPAFVINPNSFSDETSFADALLEQLSQCNPTLIVLAGYLVKIPEKLIQSYPEKIINIHPSLLPNYGGKGFYGKKVHQAVLKNGDFESGCTVHFVCKEFDEGPVIAQSKVPVHASDTAESLAARILVEEHFLLPKVVEQLINKS